MMAIFKCAEIAKYSTMMGVAGGNKSPFNGKGSTTVSTSKGRRRMSHFYTSPKERANSPLFHLFVLFRPPIVWMIFICTGEGDLYIIQIQTLMFCGNTLTDTFKNNAH